MNKIIKCAFVMILSFVSQAHALSVEEEFGDSPWKNIFVGNAGEGVVLGDKVVLLDLFENNVDALYFGPVDPKVSLAYEEIHDVMADLNVSHEKVVAKLSDLNRLYPHLGDMVLYALSWNYVFTGVDYELPSWGEYRPSPISSEYKVIRLATRRDKLIVVDKKALLKMDEDQRVALIIHEALYGFAKPRVVDGYSAQVSKDIRDIVAGIFVEGFERNENLRALVFARLALPSLEELASSVVLRVSLDDDVIERSGLDEEALMKEIGQTLCSRHVFNENLKSTLRIEKTSRVPEASTYIYKSHYGPQMASRGEMSEQHTFFPLKKVSAHECLESMTLLP